MDTSNGVGLGLQETPEPINAQQQQREKRRLISSKLWHRYKDQIFVLYVEEDRRVEDVKRIMSENQGFDATIQEYKKRFRKWQFKKNFDIVTVGAAFRLVGERTKAGETSIVTFNGRLYDLDGALRYLRRKKMSPEEAIAQAGLGTPPGLEVLSSPPISLSPPQPVIPFPPVTAVWRYAEREICLQSHIRYYVKASFQEGLWFTAHEDGRCVGWGIGRGRLFSLFNTFETVRSPAEAKMILQRSIPLIKDALFAEDPHLLLYVFGWIIGLTRKGVPGLGSIVIREFSNEAAASLFEGHSLREVLALAASSDLLSGELIFTGLQNLMDTFQHFLGRDHHSTLWCRLWAIEALELYNGLKGTEKRLRYLLSCYQRVFGPLQFSTLNILESLARNLYMQKNFDECETILKVILERIPFVVFSFGPLASIRYAALELSAMIYRERGEIGEAIILITEAIEWNVKVWGIGDSVTIRYLVLLRDLFIDQTNYQQANDVQQLLHEIRVGMDHRPC